MTTPVEHRTASADTSAGAPGSPARNAGDAEDTASPTSPEAAPVPRVRRAVPAERRGRTEIPDRVVLRIATHAAGEVARVREVRERGPLAFGGHTRATVSGELATLELEVSVDYPAPLLQMAEEIRQHVNERVHTLTGLTVGQIDIDVTGVVASRHKDNE